MSDNKLRRKKKAAEGQDGTPKISFLQGSQI